MRNPLFKEAEQDRLDPGRMILAVDIQMGQRTDLGGDFLDWLVYLPHVEPSNQRGLRKAILSVLAFELVHEFEHGEQTDEEQPGEPILAMSPWCDQEEYSEAGNQGLEHQQ